MHYFDLCSLENEMESRNTKMKQLACLTLTHYADVTRVRQVSEWSQEEGPYLFSTRSLAERFLCSHLVTFIHEHCQHGVDFNRDNEKFNKDGLIRKRFRNDLAVLEELADYYNAGEHVCPLIKWQLTDVVVDANVPATPPRKKHKLLDNCAEEK